MVTLNIHSYSLLFPCLPTYAADGAITEGTVNIIMVSPLLELMGLCDPPFKIRGEKYVKVEIEDQGESETVLEGFKL